MVSEASTTVRRNCWKNSCHGWSVMLAWICTRSLRKQQWTDTYRKGLEESAAGKISRDEARVVREMGLKPTGYLANSD